MIHPSPDKRSNTTLQKTTLLIKYKIKSPDFLILGINNSINKSLNLSYREVNGLGQKLSK